MFVVQWNEIWFDDKLYQESRESLELFFVYIKYFGTDYRNVELIRDLKKYDNFVHIVDLKWKNWETFKEKP